MQHATRTCFAQCPNPRVGREKASKTMQLAKKGKIITDSSQGSCRIQRSAAWSESPEPQLGEHKQLVAGLSRLVTCLQSNFIGTNFHGLLFKLRRSRAFPLSLMFPLFPFWAPVDWLAPGGLMGVGNLTNSGETEI